MNASSTPASRKPAWLGWLLLVLIGCELLHLYAAGIVSQMPASVLVAILPLAALPWLKLREGYLLGLCVLLIALAAIAHRDVAGLIAEGLTRSAYLASFILLMALLREGAQQSPAVLDVGTYLTRQPSSRRFLSVFGGAHFFGVLVNLGALSLLSPIIQRGVRAGLPEGAPLDDISEVRERRQLTATLRGFSWILVWAPTAVTQAVMPTLMPGIEPLHLIGLGLILAVLMLLVSWAEDALRWRGFAKKLRNEGRLPLPVATRLPVRAFGDLGLVCLILVGLSVGFMFEGGVSIVTGVMLAAPVVVIGWVYVQQDPTAPGGRMPLARARLKDITFITIPDYIREAVFLACAGFIGTLAARLVPADTVAASIGLADLPGWLVLWVLTVAVWVFGQLGLSPITMAVFLASLVAELPGLPVDHTHAALAIAAGTAVCTTGAPFASGALMLSRATGYTPTTLTWNWNGRYTLAVLTALALFYAVIAEL